jgi:hypothetical protein
MNDSAPIVSECPKCGMQCARPGYSRDPRLRTRPNVATINNTAPNMTALEAACQCIVSNLVPWPQPVQVNLPGRVVRLDLRAESGFVGRVALTTGVCSTTNIPPRRVENRRIQMRQALSCALLASALLGLSACNKAESPDKVQADVAKAQSDAAEANAKADEKQKQVEAEAAKDRADAQVKAADKSVGAVVDSAVTQAEGETKVALAKCEALEGDAQKACKDKANAHMDAVKEKAKAVKSD